MQKAEHKKERWFNHFEAHKKTVHDLYGWWSALPEASQYFINNVMRDGHFAEQ
jgi:hypothetical protein